MDNNNRPTPETDKYVNADWWTLFRATEHARILERECDEARAELEEYRSIAENIGAKKAVSEKEKAIRERDETLKLGNNLADECERILGLGLHQNTLPRFKAALEAWRKNT